MSDEHQTTTPIVISRDLYDFLRGIGSLEGCYFGERPLGERGAFWWRKYLPTTASMNAKED